MANDQVRTLQIIFSAWQDSAAANAFSSRSELSTKLAENMPSGGNGDKYVDVAVAKLFASAALEIWLRAIHSLLISVAVKDISPLWSSVSGYYATHYTFRAAAHVLGHFQLFRHKLTVQIRVEKGKFICAYTR